MNNNITLHYYSERGLVDYLITWLKYEASINDIKRFFKYMSEEISDNYKIDIYNEFSFGEFGSPDLIIKVTTNECTKVFIIEAKLDTFEKAATKLEDRKKYKGNASEINIQLLLRKKFITILNSNDTDRLFLPEKEYTTKNGRALDKKELVNWARKELKGDFRYYYVALVREDENTDDIWNKYFNFKENFLGEEKIVLGKEELRLISWKNINELLKDNDIYKEIWENTDNNFSVEEI